MGESSASSGRKERGMDVQEMVTRSQDAPPVPHREQELTRAAQLYPPNFALE
jgi:hypothetical protein